MNVVDDFAKFAAVPESYAPPEAKPFAPREDLMSWLLDPRGRDQFAARFADETELYWNDAHAKRPDEVYRRSYWTESYVQWSPRGNYITTVHRQGIALWGGPGFARLARMQHPGVQFLEYSPGEKYIATCSVTEPTNPRESVSVNVAFFDVRSGRKLRGFTGGLEDFLLPGAAGSGGGRSGFTWPVFKWAGGAEDKYFAKIGKNAVSIYEAPDMSLLDKKSLKLEGVTDFLWSPAEAVLAVYQPEQNAGNTPARVSLWAIPSRREVRQKQLFNVKMFWHPQGDYLCVKGALLRLHASPQPWRSRAPARSQWTASPRRRRRRTRALSCSASRSASAPWRFWSWRSRLRRSSPLRGSRRATASASSTARARGRTCPSTRCATAAAASSSTWPRSRASPPTPFSGRPPAATWCWRASRASTASWSSSAPTRWRRSQPRSTSCAPTSTGIPPAATWPPPSPPCTPWRTASTSGPSTASCCTGATLACRTPRDTAC